MVKFPTETRPWAPIIKLILDGKVRASFHRTPTKTLFHAVSVSGVEEHRSTIQSLVAQIPHPHIERVTVLSIVRMLSLSKYAAIACMEEQGLIALDKKRTAAFDQIFDFCKTFIMANEFAALIGVPTINLERTIGHVIKPAFDLGSSGGGLIYRRAEVTKLLHPDHASSRPTKAA